MRSRPSRSNRRSWSTGAATDDGPLRQRHRRQSHPQPRPPFHLSGAGQPARSGGGRQPGGGALPREGPGRGRARAHRLAGLRGEPGQRHPPPAGGRAVLWPPDAQAGGVDGILLRGHLARHPVRGRARPGTGPGAAARQAARAPAQHCRPASITPRLLCSTSSVKPSSPSVPGRKFCFTASPVAARRKFTCTPWRRPSSPAARPSSWCPRWP